MKQVYLADNPFQADRACELLAAAGVVARAQREQIADLFVPGASTPIWVDDRDEDRAREVLAAWEAGRPGGDDAPGRASRAEAQDPERPARGRWADVEEFAEDRPPTALPPALRRSLWLELAAVIVIGAAPWYLLSAHALAIWSPPSPPLERLPWDLLSLAQIVAVLWIVLRWRGSGESWGGVGIRAPRVALDLLVAATGLAGWFVLVRVFDPLLQGSAAGEEAEEVWISTEGWLDVSALWITTFAAAAAEDLLWRGYVLGRLRKLTGSVPVAVVLSSLGFGLHHMHYGVGGVLLISAFGALFALLYLLRPSVWPLILAHALWNLLVVGD